MKEKSFKQKVFEIVSKIPKGKTLSYGQVATRAGSPKAFRAVGNILNKNYDTKIPCHRVILSDGKIGGYNRGHKNKIKLLKKERE
ncbi:MAG: 6-O-methylguanine DNA methyltransferase [Candidatus Zambryskibacteria bacterium RIFOXYC1_FULL_39_10]|uniref:6-O-methylguanine DNA methyltransferase n=1 Tax=Candidatus Zambryskibacteria bacterium RIFOXYC1_FULL_39_10 TaxID=1802779 RepID=A0A1G2UYI1_9BACT|nr:MAG: 6-O-methylguanine DNA methyltransferase [Candidatus Zambryskibacteria bacterium RIFOXYC1_FULL_39_10]OHB16792.1 MAG: 6-O-methylguanine DNA methyltransferase [Candidatus Zambryskibacteria bacterium RIFOXYD1_FULL_39_35]